MFPIISRPTRIALLLLLAASTGPAQTEDTYRAQIEKDRHDTDEMLRSSRSPLLLVGRFPVNEGTATLGSDPASTIVLPAKAPAHVGTLIRTRGQITFRPANGVAVSLNDKPVSGPVNLQATEPPKPTDRVGFGDFKFGIRPLNQEFSLLLSDAQSPYLKSFTGTTWFPIDAAYRVVAQFVPAPQQKTLLVPSTDGGQKTYTVTGDLTFQLAGQTLRLKALGSASGKGLFIMFQDQTSGKETYGGGRFIDADASEGGKVTLDFNKASNPYCAYDPYAVCPMPLKENRLAVAIRAGEKHADIEAARH
ncbi:MAG: DUF1684 domain-containing protein [Terriglobales bacterium]